MARATEFSRRERLFGTLFSIAVMAAVAAPMVYGKDDFPLSNYPMFSRKRDPVAKVYHVVGFSSVGNHRPLPPKAVGTDEIMQAWQTVKLAVRRRPHGARDLCKEVAQYASTHEEYDDLLRIEVRVDWFDTQAYWQGNRKPVRTKVAARCPVPRRSPR